MTENPKNGTRNPGKPSRSFLKLFVWIAGIALSFYLIVGFGVRILGLAPRHASPIGKMVLFSVLYALIWAVLGVVIIGFPRWIRWISFKRFFFGFACLITLIALFYVEEDLRGKYDWESYKHQWEAKGVKFGWMDFAPPAVQDDQNFAMSPVWIARIKWNFKNDPQKAKAWYGDQIDSDEVAKFYPLVPIGGMAVVGTNFTGELPPTPEMPVRWTSAQTFDLKRWQSYYRNLEQKHPEANIRLAPQPQSPAADVLLALSIFDPAIDRLQKDSARPESRFPVLYDVDDTSEIFLPHLAAIKGCGQVLNLRAIAELQNGQTEQAANDVQLMLRLVDSVQTEPFIITHLVRMAVMQMAIQCIYEGLAEHKWSDAQLADMDAELAKINYPADFQFCVRAETAGHAKIFEWIEQKRSRGRTLVEDISNYGDKRVPTSTINLLSAGFHLMPKGWFYQGDLMLAEHGQLWSSLVKGDGQPVISPQTVLQASNETMTITGRHGLPFNFLGLGGLLIPELSTYAKRTAFAQTSADLARIAIALERYYLANGGYPASLDPLSPKYLQEIPTDIINGEPLQYRQTQDGRFVLYSVGWNEKDDGGVAIAAKGSIGTGIDVDKGDWVWRYPEKK
jgi:hypothetical protein